MNAKILILAAIPIMANAQGFAGLGSDAEGYSTPQRPAQFAFPRDHSAHSDFRIEWWYLTANLTDAAGVDYGVQWTLFRSALAPYSQSGWQDPQIWMGHAAVTSPDAHFVAERFARGGIGQAGATHDPIDVWVDEWSMSGPTFDSLELTAGGSDFGYQLQLEAAGPLVFHGDGGYSVKSEQGQASYYYSQPFYGVTGSIQLENTEIEVSGSAWLDREWSSQPLASGQTGWDWFSLNLDTGSKIMVFQLRQSDGTAYYSGTWIGADNKSEPLTANDFMVEPTHHTIVSNRQIPTQWTLSIPDRGISTNIESINPQSWMDTSVPYWEGPVRISGSHGGRGYLEMTGYPELE